MFAWVIVRYDSCKQLRYWTGSGLSLDHLEAVRFCREIDAARTVESLASCYEGVAVEQHAWAEK